MCQPFKPKVQACWRQGHGFDDVHTEVGITHEDSCGKMLNGCPWDGCWPPETGVTMTRMALIPVAL